MLLVSRYRKCFMWSEEIASTHTLLHNHSYFQHSFAALTPSTFRQPPLASSLTCPLTFDLTHFSRWPTLYLTHVLWLNLTYTHYCTTLFLIEILWNILPRTVRPPLKKTSPECTGGAPLKSDSQQEISPKNIPYALACALSPKNIPYALACALKP